MLRAPSQHLELDCSSIYPSTHPSPTTWSLGSTLGGGNPLDPCIKMMIPQICFLCHVTVNQIKITTKHQHKIRIGICWILTLCIGRPLITNDLWTVYPFQIFLRELISNASDALDKIRLLSLTNEDAMASNEELTIKIKVCTRMEWDVFCLQSVSNSVSNLTVDSPHSLTRRRTCSTSQTLVLE